MKIPLAIAVAAFSTAVLMAFNTPSAAASDTLPAQCRAASADAGAMGSMDMGPIQMNSTEMPAIDKAHRDLMQGMDQMNAEMAEGMKAADPDVAFICGMIPHHQGAIDMARAELAHGRNPFARTLAQEIINSQEKQIAEMIDWLESGAKP